MNYQRPEWSRWCNLLSSLLLLLLLQPMVQTSSSLFPIRRTCGVVLRCLPSTPRPCQTSPAAAPRCWSNCQKDADDKRRLSADWNFGSWERTWRDDTVRQAVTAGNRQSAKDNPVRWFKSQPWTFHQWVSGANWWMQVVAVLQGRWLNCGGGH